ncbi:hypothetical protein GRJ2_001673100 [Grus japonensis]|uniref:Uncharacterized protein n=1 Tax=Grus japonensis TaxID=30415 RepID=A0ABC9X328_GRUJA
MASLSRIPTSAQPCVLPGTRHSWSPGKNHLRSREGSRTGFDYFSSLGDHQVSSSNANSRNSCPVVIFTAEALLEGLVGN